MNGLIVINKESGPTSRDIVNIIGKNFNTKKVGHTGTLDPLACGVLVICIGRYTKLVDKIISLEKEYISKIKLGIKTDTLDITGNILEEQDVPNFNKEQINNVLKSFLGEGIQETPIYSAVKINGKKLYEYARNNEEISLPKRNIHVYNIELLDYQNDEITFKVKVSKGTYIRSLINDICLKLNTIGTMSYLQRTKQGKFNIEDSFSIEDVKNNRFNLLSCQDIFDYPEYKLNEEEYFKVKNGNKINVLREEKYLLLTYNNEEIAIYHKEDNFYNCDVMLKI